MTIKKKEYSGVNWTFLVTKLAKVFLAINCAPSNAYQYFDLGLSTISIKLFYKYKEIKPVNPKRNQPWAFIGRTDAEAEVPMIWSPDAKSWLIGKDSGVGKDWGSNMKSMAKDDR